MNVKVILSLLPVLLIIFVGLPDRVFAQNRSLYVGDIIRLEISSLFFSIEELREKFQDFEILDIVGNKDGTGTHLVSVRTFETGEHKIQLGDKEIIILVQSILDNIQRQDLLEVDTRGIDFNQDQLRDFGGFEGDSRVIEPDFSFPWLVLLYISVGIFVVSGLFILFNNLKKEKIKAPSPSQVFFQRSSALSAADGNYFVSLTFYFKQYLENLYQCKIIGKTSAEIVNDLQSIKGLNPLIPEIREWLTECDKYKFTGHGVSQKDKQNHYEELLDLVPKIDLQKEGAMC